VNAHIGVPEEERASRQRLLIDVEIRLRTGFSEMNDDVSRTVDYDQLAKEIVEVSEAKSRRLIETLAADVMAVVMGNKLVDSAHIEIRKFILKHTEYVAVHLDS